MEIKRVCALYFSATGNTEKTVAAFAETLAEQLGVPWERLPFTKPAERERDYMFADTDLVVVGTPTYAGKLPNKILPDLKARLHGNGALAAAIVTFGNRSYDNALAELCAVLEGDGFYTVAGGAFVGRHAFTDKLAEDRPDWDDRKELKKFATAIADKVKNLTENPAPVTVPGDRCGIFCQDFYLVRKSRTCHRSRRPGGPVLHPQGHRRRACQVPEGQTPDRPDQVHELRHLRPAVPHGGH